MLMSIAHLCLPAGFCLNLAQPRLILPLLRLNRLKLSSDTMHTLPHLFVWACLARTWQAQETIFFAIHTPTSPSSMVILLNSHLQNLRYGYWSKKYLKFWLKKKQTRKKPQTINPQGYSLTVQLRLSHGTHCTYPRRSKVPPLSLKHSPLILSRALLGFFWKIQLWSVEGSWRCSSYTAVKLVWNVLTQMQVESKCPSPSQWIYWGLSRKLLVSMLAYWQQGMEFLLPFHLPLLLVLYCEQTAPRRQINRRVLHFSHCVENCHGYEHI